MIKLFREASNITFNMFKGALNDICMVCLLINAGVL